MDGVSLNSDPCRSRTCVVLPTVWCMVYRGSRLLRGKFVSVALRLGASTEGQSHCSEPNSHPIIIITYSVLRQVFNFFRSEMTRLCDLCFLSQVPVPSLFLKVI
jgi:hypothetical protein